MNKTISSTKAMASVIFGSVMLSVLLLVILASVIIMFKAMRQNKVTSIKFKEMVKEGKIAIIVILSGLSIVVIGTGIMAAVMGKGEISNDSLGYNKQAAYYIFQTFKIILGFVNWFLMIAIMVWLIFSLASTIKIGISDLDVVEKSSNTKNLWKTTFVGVGILLLALSLLSISVVLINVAFIKTTGEYTFSSSFGSFDIWNPLKDFTKTQK